MGDPRKIRAKYSGPSHPWQRKRIEEEKIILDDFGLKNKKEIWKMQSRLRSFKVQAKALTARKDEQSKKEEKALLVKLYNLGMVDEGVSVEKILDLSIHDILNRRLQSMVFKQNLAHSMKQARQFIVHGHIMVGEDTIDVPSYIVKRAEEPKIKFADVSSLKDPEHPERAKEKKKQRPRKEKETGGKATLRRNRTRRESRS